MLSLTDVQHVIEEVCCVVAKWKRIQLTKRLMLPLEVSNDVIEKMLVCLGESRIQCEVEWTCVFGYVLSFQTLCRA